MEAAVLLVLVLMLESRKLRGYNSDRPKRRGHETR